MAVDDVFAAVHALVQLVRLTRRHLVDQALPHGLGRAVAEKSVLASRDDHVAHRHADLHDVPRHAVHVEETLVEQDQPVLGVDRAHPVRHLVDRLVVALELDAQVVLLALALAHVLDQRDPAAVGHGPVMQRKSTAVGKLAPQLERLAARHQFAAAAMDLLSLAGRKVAAGGGPVDQLADRHAGAYRPGRQAEHLDEALIEQDDALLGIDHAQAMRHAFERRPLQRDQRLQPVSLLVATGRGCRHSVHAHCPALPPRQSGRLRNSVKLRVNRIGLNFMTVLVF